MPTSKKRSTKKSMASSIADFKSKSGGLTELPSGLVVKLKNKGGMRAFVSSGIIPNSLMGIIQEAIGKGKEPDMSGIFNEDGSINEQMMSDMLALTDNVVVQTMSDPEVLPVPTEEDVKEWNKTHPKSKVENPDDLRDEDALYTDEIDEEDKMFIFQWVTGGTRDIEQFRKEFASTMDDLAGQQDIQSKAKQSTGSRKR